MGILSTKDTSGDDEIAFDFHFPTSKKALIIFVKNPELGKVKTRLAKTVGDESALNIYKFLLKHTAEITETLQVDKYVFYAENIEQDDVWNPDIFRKKLQKGKDFGERMKNAFSEIFDMGYESVILIGCDVYNLIKNDLENAFNALQDNPFVIGPAADGGYYLLGKQKPFNTLFENKNWYSNTVLKETLNDLRDKKYILLDERNVVDFYNDIKNIAEFQQFLPPHLDNNFI